jgi:ectoine hydroxylase-related dioxygenase (phytanoyl-CoA dioxygenase family)
MLTEQQRTFFDTFGFLVLRQAFSPEEIGEISREFEEVLDVDRQGRVFDGQKRQAVLAFVEQRAGLTKLVEDDRIYCVIEELLGSGFVWIGSDGNLYVGDTRWHPDNAETYPRIKVAFYLDRVTKDSGCLRVIPGSHRPPLRELLKAQWPKDDPAESPYGVSGSEIPSYPLESEPGDVVVFNQGLWHASYGGKSGRRMFTLNFGAKPQTEADYDNLRRTYHNNLTNISKMQRTQTGRVYTDSFLGSEAPRIHSVVAELVEMGFK